MKQFIAQALIVHRSTDPTVNDNLGRGFDVESEWYNGVKFWKLISFSGSYANWSLVGSGGVSTFSALTDSPYDNTLLAEALDSKQDKPNGVLTGCTITLGSFPLGKNVRITEGTWRILSLIHI